MARFVVALADEIPAGGRKIVRAAGRSIGIFNIDGKYFALRDRCPHQGGPLCSGYLWENVQSSRPGEYSYAGNGKMLRCPWHGWEYDVRTGQSWFAPTEQRVRSYEVTVEQGGSFLEDPDAPAPGLQKGPYVAETFPVSIEKNYIVISIGI